MTTRRVTMAIYDLGCGGGGSLTIERALSRIMGVVRASVNPTTEMAYVEYDPAFVRPADLVAMVAGLGFRADEPREH